MKNTNTNNTALTPMNESFIPESITVGKDITVKAGESLMGNEYGYINHTGDEKLDKAIDTLNKCSQALTMSKITVGFTLNSIARDEIYKAKFKTVEEFYKYCGLTKNTANRWRAVAKYLTKEETVELSTGKTKTNYKLVKTDKMIESVIFAAYAVMNDKGVHLIPADVLETLCANNTIRTAKELYKAYNEYVQTLDTEDKPKLLDDNGKPTESAADSATVETTADSIATNGGTNKRFEVHGDSKAKSLYIPESAIENGKTLYEYVLKNGYDIAKTLGLDVDKENDIVFNPAQCGSMLIMTAIQHKPTAKAVIFYRDTTNNHGKGIKAKDKTETETETETK